MVYLSRSEIITERSERLFQCPPKDFRAELKLVPWSENCVAFVTEVTDHGHRQKGGSFFKMKTESKFVARFVDFSASEYKLIAPGEDRLLFAEASIREFEQKGFEVSDQYHDEQIIIVWFELP